MKIKRLLSPIQSMGNVFRGKALHGGAKFFDEIFWGMFYIGTNDQIMQGGS